MRMTREQAMAELARLCEAMDRTLDNLRPHQTREWVDALCGMSYERGRAAITQLIKTWTWRNFPPVGALHKAETEVSREGQPNAGAYSQNGQAPAQSAEQIAAVVQQQDRWLAMDDAEYFAEVQRMHASGAIQIRGG